MQVISGGAMPQQDYDTKLFRLIRILNKLESSHSVSVKSLSEDFDVTVRTVQRDICRLMSAGFPIVQGEAKGEYSFYEGFSLKKLSLSDEEATLLTLLSDTASALGSNFEKSFKRLFTKITTPLESQYTPYHLIAGEAAHCKEDYAFSVDLETAIDERLKVELDFSKYASKGIVKYTGCPLKIVLWDGFWYLMLIMDGKEDNIWKLRFDNIKAVRLLETKFKRPANVEKMLADCTNVWFSAERNITAKLRVNSSVAQVFHRKHIFPLQKIIHTEPDGSLILETKLCRHMEAIPDILYWIPQIEVLEPEPLKAELKQMLANYAQKLQ